MRWDQAEYVELIEQGQQAYDEATALPADAIHRRHQLLYQSARVKAGARRLLYFAIVTGEFDDVLGDAISEWFNLSENLVVTLVQIGECDASELILDELQEHREQLQSDALEYLDTLPARIESCRSHVVSGANTWDPRRFHELRNDADEWLERSSQSDAGSTAQRDLLLESVWSREQSVDLLRSMLFTYAEAPGVENPTESLFEQYPPLIDALVRLGFCDTAERRLLQRRIDAQVLQTEPTTADADLASQIEGCRGSASE
jgi:hypothetical protein